MKVGMIALATDQGLGYLARDFYRNGLVDFIYIHEHSSRKSHQEWYSPESIVPTREVLLEKSDVIFGIETFFDWKIIPQAKAQGKKTVLMVDYECTPYPLPYFPDLVICPSALDFDVYAELYKGHDIGYETRNPQITSDSPADYPPCPR